MARIREAGGMIKNGFIAIALALVAEWLFYSQTENIYSTAVVGFLVGVIAMIYLESRRYWRGR